MTRYGSLSVQDMFASVGRDWTPASEIQGVTVLFAPFSSDTGTTALCASVLSESELERADRFIVDDGRALFIQRRAFRRYCGALALGTPQPLSRINFEETDKGRPYLPNAPGISFSFSSCRLGFLGAWSTIDHIGVDLEDPERPVEAEELAERFFSPAEAAAIAAANTQIRLRTFFQFWTLKEAALKAIGEGLPFGLDAFQFALEPDMRVVDAPRDYGGSERFTAFLIGDRQDCAALVTRSTV